MLLSRADPEIAGSVRMSGLSHLDKSGRARMVDVSEKAATARKATAMGQLRCSPQTLDLVRAGKAPKGSVIQTAELAGVMAAKRTAELIPLCHPLPLDKIDVVANGIYITSDPFQNEDECKTFRRRFVDDAVPEIDARRDP